MARLWLIPLMTLLLAACGGEPDDPEGRLRATIVAAEQAIEDRALKEAAAYVSPAYRDDSGRDARQVRQLLIGYLYRNRDIHLFTRITDLRLAEDGRAAQVRLYAAMAGVPIQSLEALVSVRADLHRFDLRFVDGEEGWLLTSAAWQRASLDELLE